MSTSTRVDRLYGRGEGFGFTLGSSDELREHVDAIPVTIGGETLHVKGLTNMQGFFGRALRYEGMMKDEPDCMVFHLGRYCDMFTEMEYYLIITKISETRVFSMYTMHSGRDFNQVNGEWK